MMDDILPCDEMIDHAGHIRAPWRPVLDVMMSLGTAELGARKAALDRQARFNAPFGAIAPGRYDPLPVPLTEFEFAGLEAAVRQRATLLGALVEDIYDRQTLLDDGTVSPDLVFPNPGFLRSLRNGSPLASPRLGLYGVDVIRLPEGGFQIVADHTGAVPGLGHALAIRRFAAGVLPELFRGVTLMSQRPAVDSWQDYLHGLAGYRPVAVLASPPGTVAGGDPVDCALLARAIGAMLLEPGDLAVRGGLVQLKTLGGLVPVPVLIRRLTGQHIDPLEMGGKPGGGISGLLGALRAHRLIMLNAPGSAMVEAPGFAALLPQLARQILGQELMLGYGPADGRESRVPLAGIDRRANGLDHAPLTMRLFAWHDGHGWQVLPGGLGFARLPDGGVLMKDIWVMEASEPRQITGARAAEPPPRSNSLAAIGLPSRVADNLFWLGRAVERLEWAARLMMLALPRLTSGTSLPREAAELGLLGRCLAHAKLIPRELGGKFSSGRLLRSALARRRRLGSLAAEVSRLLTASSERLSPSMLATVESSLETTRAAIALDEETAVPSVLGFAACFAGIAAENMSRGGGWLFLEMGRRLERAENASESLAILLDGPEERLQPGLGLGIALADSVLSYELSYAGVIAPAPVLDMLIADASNPRGLYFQCAALYDVLQRLDAVDDALEAKRLMEEARSMGARLPPPGQDSLPLRLTVLADRLRGLSDQIERRFFTLLPVAHQMDEDEQASLDMPNVLAAWESKRA